MRDERIFDELRDSWGDPSEEELRALHQAVMARVRPGAPQSRAFRWYATAAAIAAIAVVCMLYSNSRRETALVAEVHPPVSSRAAAVPKIASPEPVAPKIATVRLTPRRHRRPVPGIRSVALIARGDQPPMIKMTTSDPNVVILLETHQIASTERTQTNE